MFLRLVSTILDPISFGHILTSGFVTLYFIKGIVKNRKIYLFLILFGYVINYVNAIFQLILCLTLFTHKLNSFLRFLIPLIVLISGYFLIDLRGIIIHFTGLYYAIVNINWFGHGLGLERNYAKMFANDLTVYKLA